MTGATQPLDIRTALAGETLFITGATGFVGGVVVEKLLWSVPEVAKLILLVRPSAERQPRERLHREVLASPAFSRLRALHADDWESWVEARVEVVAGDLTCQRFGLAAGDYEHLAARVDRVISCAADVTFDQRLDRALAVNVDGALAVVELARAAGAAPLLHVSTCFVSGRRQGPIDERIAAPQLGGDEELDGTVEVLRRAARQAEEAPDPHAALVRAGAEMAARYDFHDVYTLTKAAAERLVARDRGAVPVAILRPAIVESAAAEPVAGWIDGVRVADPLLVAYGRGQTRELPARPDARLEIVPVDHVANAILAALARLGPATTSGGPATALRVYQVGSARHPITVEQLMDSAREGFAEQPLRDERERPIAVRPARFVDAGSHRRRLAAKRRWVARLARLASACGLDAAARRAHKAGRLLDHLARLVELYGPYLDQQAIYLDTATRELAALLSPASRRDFPFDPERLDWPSYIARRHLPGLLRFALRAESGAPPPATREHLEAEERPGTARAAGATTLFELLALAAAANPRAIAFQTCRGGRWLRYSYGEALTATANIASRLAERHGIGRGDRVVLWGSASPEWILTSFAIHRLGAVTVPLDPQWPPAEVERAARFTEAALICAAPDLGATLDAAAGPVMPLAAPWVPEPEVALLPGVRAEPGAGAASDLASILFTSGTTVAPRAVPLTHDNILANVRALVPVMESSRERLLSVLPIHHVFELTVGHLVPLVGGGTISYVAELKPADIGWMMKATRPTTMVAVPRLLELLHNGIRQNVEARGRLVRGLFRGLVGLGALCTARWRRRLFPAVHRRFGGSLRRIATGGSALDPRLGRSFQRLGFQVAEGYGMTETSPVLSVNPWSEIRLGSVGRPLSGVEIDVLPPAGTEKAPEPRAGEIRVRGANVMAGYYRNEQASREALRDGWLHTGDLGYLDRDGYLHLAGRVKDVIVTSAGKSVYPEEVERRYQGLAGVQELAILGLSDDGYGDRVAAVVVPRPGATPEDRERIREAIAERSREVPSYQRISRVELWEGDLPKTTTLKVQRSRLRDLLLTGAVPEGRSIPQAPPARAPRIAVELPSSPDRSWILATLARLTRSRGETLRPEDRLTELGLDSLTRLELVAALEGRFGLRVDDESLASLSRVQDLFDLVPPAATARQRPGGRLSAS